MLIQTKHFGQLEIEETEIISFPEGILGFPETTRYIILQEEKSPFFWLQAVESSEPCFVLINPQLVKTDYNPKIDQEALTNLGIEDKHNLLYYTIVVVPENIQQIRTNLQAPLAINLQKKIAKQIVLNQPEYPIRYAIFDYLKGGAENAGIDSQNK